MPDILKTEASLVNTSSFVREVTPFYKEGKITKLSGIIGEERMKLYSDLSVYQPLPVEIRPFLAIGFNVTTHCNALSLACSLTLCPLYFGDTITALFEDETRVKLKVVTKGVRFGDERRVHVPLTDHQLAAFTQQNITSISVYNHKALIPFDFEPTETPNDQYSSITEAKKLLRIMAERIVACKALLIAGN